MPGKSSWNGPDFTDVEIEVDLTVLASRLAKDSAFIEAVSSKIRKEMTKDARRLGNLFGQWAGK